MCLRTNSQLQLYEQYLKDTSESVCTLFEISSYPSSCPAACHLARCCCPAGCRRSWRGRSPHAQTRCDWRQRKPSRRTPSPCAASSPDRRRRHSQLHGSVSLPGGAKNSQYNTQFKGHIYTLDLDWWILDHQQSSLSAVLTVFFSTEVL